MENRTTPYPRIGLDRVHLYGIRYGIVNRALLMDEAKKDKVKYYEGSIEYSPDPKTVEHIVIRDNIMFADLRLRRVLVPNRGIKIYGEMDLTVHHLCGNNLNNLSVEEYKLSLVEIRQYVAETYGIKLDFYEAKVRLMEVNCTFSLRHPFCEYERVIRIFFEKIPGKEKLGDFDEKALPVKSSKASEGDRLETRSWWRGNKQTEVVVYNKSRELKKNDNIIINENRMRFEIRLLTERKVKAVFGTNVLKDITDGMVVDFFYNKVCGVYHKNYEKWHNIENVKQLQDKVKEYKGKDKKWHDRLVENCLNIEIETHLPIILDIDDLKDVIPQDKHYNRSRTLRPFDKCTEATRVLFRHDRDKEPEIIGQIKTAYQNSISDSDDDV